MTIRGLCVFIAVLLLFTCAQAQRVVVVCLPSQDEREQVNHLIRQSGDLQGAQALVLSRTASSPWARSAPLAHRHWERSAYLTLNAGARALAPENATLQGTKRLRALVETNRHWGYPVRVGMLPVELKARGVRLRYLVLHDDSPMLLVGAPFPEPDTRAAANFRVLLRMAGLMLNEHSRQMLWIDPGVMSPSQAQELLRTLIASLRLAQDKLYLLMPVPSRAEASEGSRLGWVMRIGREEMGVLVSRSTRLPGFVTLPDLTATWLAHFDGGSVPAEVIGAPVQTVPHEQPAQAVRRLYDSLMRQVWWNRTVGTLPTVQAVVLVLAWLVWYRFRKVVRALWLFPCIVPVLGIALAPILICLPLWGITMPYRAGVWVTAVVVLLVLLSRLPLHSALRGLSIVLLVFVGVDLVNGGNLLRWSGFGYVIQEGARYYGIGNEMAGSLFGAQSGFLVLEGAGWGVFRWLMTALAVGAPFWGANTGAMLAGLCVAVTQAVRWRRGLVWAVGAIVLLVAGVIAWEMLSPQPTHLGTFLRAPHTWLLTLWRKVQMNLALVVNSAWTPLLVFGLFGLKQVPRSVWVAVFALLILNDSGVVAAAAMLAWWWAWRMAQREPAT